MVHHQRMQFDFHFSALFACIHLKFSAWIVSSIPPLRLHKPLCGASGSWPKQYACHYWFLCQLVRTSTAHCPSQTLIWRFRRSQRSSHWSSGHHLPVELMRAWSHATRKCHLPLATTYHQHDCCLHLSLAVMSLWRVGLHAYHPWLSG